MSDWRVNAEMLLLAAANGDCRHAAIVPVDLALTGEVVAYLCADCSAQLAVEWVTRWPVPTRVEMDAVTTWTRR